jgi:hypothetical protein
MTKTVAIVQSNYIPWKGYFDLIRRCDEFVLYDDVQYTRRDWRNRNRLKTADGVQWLSIPVAVKGKYHQRIRDTRIVDPAWAKDHWTRLRQAYGKAPCFDDAAAVVEEAYSSATSEYLSDVNRHFLRLGCGWLGISTPLSSSSDYLTDEGDATERLINICLRTKATTYLSGPAAKAYLAEERFRAAGIEVVWMDYAGYPEYMQLHGPFEHSVTFLDLLFHTGSRASEYLSRIRHAA